MKKETLGLLGQMVEFLWLVFVWPQLLLNDRKYKNDPDKIFVSVVSLVMLRSAAWAGSSFVARAVVEGMGGDEDLAMSVQKAAWIMIALVWVDAFLRILKGVMSDK